MTTLKTKRLILRPWCKEDLEPFSKINQDPRVMEHFPSLLSREESDQLVQRLQASIEKKGWGLWAVSLQATEEFIGFIGLIPREKETFPTPFSPCVEIGWRLGFDHWGKGYATEGALECLRYAFETLQLPEIVSFTAVQNKRSLSLMERIGLHRDPLNDFNFPNIPDGHPLQKHVLYRLTRKEWLTHFKPVDAAHLSLVHKWLKVPHVAKWFYGDGLENTLKGLDKFLEGASDSQYWLAFEGDHPFAFFITSSIRKPEDTLSKWCEEEGEATTLDMLIGDTDYIGKGLAAPLIQQFLLAQFPHVTEVLIDPEITNARAVHVYQKAGFKILEEFTPSHSPHPHYIMRLNMRQLKP